MSVLWILAGILMSSNFIHIFNIYYQLNKLEQQLTVNPYPETINHDYSIADIRTMYNNKKPGYTAQQIDVLDLLIEIIKQHEATLDKLITRLEQTTMRI